jgi:prolyl-tRNA synthetase
LGQNFAKAFDVKFAAKDGKLDYVWATSWGVSTRLMGALIMSHSDDDGLVLPPKLAPIQVVIVPIFKKSDELELINKKAFEWKDQLEKMGISVKYDNRDNQTPGWKFADYEFKGVPVRIAVGPRDMQNATVEIARRDTKEKKVIEQIGLVDYVANLLNQIQSNLFNRAQEYRNNNIREANSWEEFKSILDGPGGFIFAHWDGSPETEQKIKEETKATIRCIPLQNKKEVGKCVYSGKPSTQRVLFARAY